MRVVPGRRCAASSWPDSYGDFLALKEGVLVERVCEAKRVWRHIAHDNSSQYSICSTELSKQEASISSQIVKELEERKTDLGVFGPNRQFYALSQSPALRLW